MKTLDGLLNQGVPNEECLKRAGSRSIVIDILAVVGLHGSTFKPHTGTKTSVLFVQKWNNDPDAGPLCPKIDDYNIFFATQKLESKNSSGDKIIAPGSDGKLLRDSHGHWVVQHDLFNHDGLTCDGIAEAFEEFAAKEELGFF